LARAISGYAEGVVSAQTIASLRGIDAEQVEAELAQAGVVPRRAEVSSLDASDLPTVSIDLSDLDDEGREGGTV
jgi:predicted HTH domain antitoxin